MIREYALEPSLLSSWDRFQRYIGHFGIHHGRLISRFPKRWKRMVIEGLSACGDIERARIVERLRSIDDRLLPRTHEWNPQQSWLVNAETEHKLRPFHAIVSESNPNASSHVLLNHDLDETDPPELWKPQRSIIVKREAVAMAAAVELLLRLSTQIVFVDPHFGPENGRHRATLEHFLLAAVQHRSSAATITVEVHTGDKATFTFFESECQSRLPSLIPTGIDVRFRRWKREQLHNRYILTNLGGVTFQHGLDENQQAAGSNEDLVQLMDADVCQQILAGYCGAEPKYTPADGADVLVFGAKPA